MKHLIILCLALLLATAGYSQSRVFNKVTVTDQFKYTAGTPTLNYILADTSGTGVAVWVSVRDLADTWYKVL
jgi:hypothetical protein